MMIVTVPNMVEVIVLFSNAIFISDPKVNASSDISRYENNLPKLKSAIVWMPLLLLLNKIGVRNGIQLNMQALIP